MEHREYESLANREEFYFWHVGRRELLAAALKKYLPRPDSNRILDIGCGTGGDMLLLRSFGRVVGLDSSQEALRLSAAKGFDSLVLGSAEKLPFASGSFELVVALDALEHLDDDRAAAREAYRVLAPRGVFLVTVPAYPWLWSQHDRALHHKRRYLKRGLVRVLEDAGFCIRYGSYFVMLGAVANGLRKFRDKLFRRREEEPRVYDVVYPPFLNSALIWELRLEKMLVRLCPLPFGSSVAAVAQKSEYGAH